VNHCAAYHWDRIRGVGVAEAAVGAVAAAVLPVQTQGGIRAAGLLGHLPRTEKGKGKNNNMSSASTCTSSWDVGSGKELNFEFDSDLNFGEILLTFVAIVVIYKI